LFNEGDMTAFAAKAYNRVSVDSAGAANDPHALIMLLFDGALAAARLGLGHMQAGRIAEKAAAVSKVTRIVDEGLKLSLDHSAGGELSKRLADLYDYMVMRLLQANLRNDVQALSEVIKLLDDLRSAWAEIKTLAKGAASPAVTANAPPQASAQSTPAAPARVPPPGVSRAYDSAAASSRLAATA
jgi:flagellar protein FliS